MSTMAVSVDPCMVDRWCVDYHKTMAATLAVGIAVKRSAFVVELKVDFWILDRYIRALLKHLDSLDTLSQDRIPGVITRFKEVHAVIEKVVNLTEKKDFAWLKSDTQSLRLHNERLQDFVERLTLSADPQIREAALEALGEYDRGETTSLESLL